MLLAHLQRVTRDEVLQPREDAVRIIQAAGDSRLALAIELVSPGLRVVFVVLLVEPAEDAILEVEASSPRKSALVWVMT